MFLIPALGNQRQVDLLAFKSNLVFTVSSRTTTRVIIERPRLKEKKKIQLLQDAVRLSNSFTVISKNYI